MNAKKFQSRNRGSCRFKYPSVSRRRDPDTCFNLVIEVLVVSRTATYRGGGSKPASFNLVIEVLVVSSR